MTARRLILEVRWGRLAGTKLVLSPGQAARVGRSTDADLPIEHDGRLSREHFELAWDGAHATLRDLDSLTGTTLGGKPVEGSARIAHGGWVQAGDTHFMVYVEGHTRAPRPPEGSGESARIERERRAAAEGALAELRAAADRDSLYAVLDAARDDRILELLREHVEPHRSLYDGVAGEALEEVAPYLAGPMRADSALLDRLVLEGWGKRWGMWCASAEPFVEVRRHWRRFLMVELEDSGQKVYFRFYDPAVMRAVWGTSAEGQREELLGRARSWFLEQPGGGVARIEGELHGHA